MIAKTSTRPAEASGDSIGPTMLRSSWNDAGSVLTISTGTGAAPGAGDDEPNSLPRSRNTTGARHRAAQRADLRRDVLLVLRQLFDKADRLLADRRGKPEDQREGHHQGQ